MLPVGASTTATGRQTPVPDAGRPEPVEPRHGPAGGIARAVWRWSVPNPELVPPAATPPRAGPLLQPPHSPSVQERVELGRIHPGRSPAPTRRRPQVLRVLAGPATVLPLSIGCAHLPRSSDNEGLDPTSEDPIYGALIGRLGPLEGRQRPNAVPPHPRWVDVVSPGARVPPESGLSASP